MNSSTVLPPSNGNNSKPCPTDWETIREQYGFGEVLADAKLATVLKKHVHLKEPLMKYVTEIERYITGPDRGVGIIMWGPPGTYKSSMLWILCKAIVHRYATLKQMTPRIKYINYLTAMKILLAERYDGYTGYGLSHSLSNVDVLMMDDIAPYGIQQNAAEEFFEILNERQLNRKVFFGTTNQTDEWCAENLPQIRDRWRTSLLLHFDGKSERRLNEDVMQRLGLK